MDLNRIGKIYGIYGWKKFIDVNFVNEGYIIDNIFQSEGIDRNNICEYKNVKAID